MLIPSPWFVNPNDSNTMGSQTENASCTSATSISEILWFDIFNADCPAITVDSIDVSDVFFVNPADVVFCPIPVIHIGMSVYFSATSFDANRIDALPVHGLEQFNNLRSSVNFLEFMTSSTVYVFFDNAFGFFLCLFMIFN